MTIELRRSTVYPMQKAMTERRDLLKKSFRFTLCTVAFVAFPFVTDKIEGSKYHKDAFFIGNPQTRFEVSLAELKQEARKGKELWDQLGQESKTVRDNAINQLQSLDDKALTEIAIQRDIQTVNDAVMQSKTPNSKDYEIPTDPVTQTSKTDQDPPTKSQPFIPQTKAEAFVNRYPQFSAELAGTTTGEALLVLYGAALSAQLLTNTVRLNRLRRIKRSMQVALPPPMRKQIIGPVKGPLGHPDQYTSSRNIQF